MNTIRGSRYKGVRWHRHCQKWESRIGTSRNRRTLGYFDNEEAAALAYNAAAIERYGERAHVSNAIAPFSKSDLRRRGWKSAQVQRLGEPDAIVPNSHYPDAAPKCLYNAERIVSAEREFGIVRPANWREFQAINATLRRIPGWTTSPA